MAKEMRITIDETTNKAINAMKAKFLLKDIELTKQASLGEIAKEWYGEKKKPIELAIMFGNYLLSDERNKTIQEGFDKSVVYDSDIGNFLNRK